MKFWDLMSRPCVEYLKNNTSMNFENVLDVGTYFGHFVRRMNREGCNTHGIEPDGCRIAQAVTDKISQGYFDHTFQTSEVYDLICFNQMLYYIQDGIRALERARGMLADGGTVLVATANPLSSMIKDKRIKIIGKGREHINCYMSRKNFESLEGFKMKDCLCFRGNMQIDAKARKYMFPLYMAGLKRIITPCQDGNNMFVLLEKTN
ncbi:MAG: class I SAM-dependent methyltransferase [Nitrosopumilus sp. H8]|nr:MAG: class I SAM-dependent methyltransferase [Nitrosopumilus sp. H8]